MYIFTSGAQWMAARMQELSPETPIVFDPGIPFDRYGWMKYGWSLLAMVITCFLLAEVHLLLAPLSVLAFYLVEIQFLFLFPLLIEKHPSPVRKSIQMTWKMGLVPTVVKVIPIAFWMVTGLFRFKRPLERWYAGCQMVLVWYFAEKNKNNIRSAL